MQFADSPPVTPDLLRRRPVGLWLLALAGMVFVMVDLGGFTRLTGSGLSMVEWQPFTLLPPLSDAAWQATFAKYQLSAQYRLINSGMTLAEFKGIFWLEYVHRLWGRLIGLAFLVPFLVFLAKGWLRRDAIPRLALLFVLGGLQGVVGWFMVKSGLAARPEVSHYRLAAHLMAALLIYGALLWSALDYLSVPGGVLRDAPFRRSSGRGHLSSENSLMLRRTRDSAAVAKHAAASLRRALLALLALVCLTIPAGALVAGLHAGLVYNTFPLMNGAWLPSEAFDLSPWWINAFENHALVQFDHRLLAIVTWCAAAALWLWSRRLALPPRLAQVIGLIPLAATLQAGLGIATLLLVVPIPLAAAHQAGAFVLFTAVLWALHEAVTNTPTVPSSPARR